MNISKIAEIAGVSNTTVSFVINGKPGISYDTAEKVREAIRSTGYIPKSGKLNRQNNGLRELQVKNIGLLMPQGFLSTIPFYATLFEAIHEQLDIRGINMSPIRCDGVSSVTKSSFDDLDGLILCGYRKDITQLLSIPFVSIISHPSAEDKLNADHIEPANDRIGVLAARYLINKGHKRLWVIDPSQNFHEAIDTRIYNFKNFAEKNRVSVKVINVPFKERDKEGRLIDGLSIEEVRNFIIKLKELKHKPTAIFIPMDSYLAVLQKSLSASGIQIGKEIELIGCNNESGIIDVLHPRPATIDINPQAIAKAAVVALLQRIIHPDEINHIYKIVSIDPALKEADSEVREKW